MLRTIMLMLAAGAVPAPQPPYTRRPQCPSTDVGGIVPAPHPLAPWDRGDPRWVNDPFLVWLAFPEGAPVLRQTHGKVAEVTIDSIRMGKPVVLVGQDRVTVEPAELQPPWQRGRPPALTSPFRLDGVGAQIHCVFATMAVAYHYGMPFCYTPIGALGHRESPGRWEEFFGLVHPELRMRCPLAQDFHDSRGHGWLRRQNISETLARQGPVMVPRCGHVMTKKRPAKFYTNAALSVFRRLLWYNTKPAVWPTVGTERRVSVHVRLGDAIRKVPDRVLPFWVVEDHIAALRERHPGASFHVHSDGRGAGALNASDVMLYINEPLASSFTRMVSADVLVLAISQLSWIAGMLSECCEVWYPQLWVTGRTRLQHRPLSHWSPFGPRRLDNATARSSA
eukprot:TRINITY_DN10691_c0_g1_i2.p1 TRINITY_DN10691_c0_g1~~TRINITY_DN10691_c0_g1_i2.p1  ORF type:complete len:394 (+),score=21.29 TRINITY_DN10691_c0_g1_i2:105-1286(+)